MCIRDSHHPSPRCTAAADGDARRDRGDARAARRAAVRVRARGRAQVARRRGRRDREFRAAVRTYEAMVALLQAQQQTKSRWLMMQLMQLHSVSFHSPGPITHVPSRTFLVFQAGHSVCSKQDIPFPITKNAHATFWRIRPIVPGFVRI